MGSEVSGGTTASPTASTPPPKSSDGMSEAATPPSPPLSDAPAHTHVNGIGKVDPRTPVPPGTRRSLLPSDAAATLRPSLYGPRAAPKHSRGPSMASSNGTSTSDARAMKPPARRPAKRPSTGLSDGLPRSDSLYQIKALRGRMQKIEERVHSARSKLPAPGTRTPTGSPRTAAGSTLSPGDKHIPSSVTMRRSIKRPSGVSTASSLANEAITASGDGSQDANGTGRRESHIKRLSYGIPRPASQAASERPPSSMGIERTPSAAGRPSSRASLASASAARPGSRGGVGGERPGSRAGMASERPGSRAGVGTERPSSRAGARTPLSSFTAAAAARPTANGTPAHGRTSIGTAPARPRSSIGGHYATVHGTPRSHRPSASVSELRRKAAESEDSVLTSSPQARRGTIDRSTFSATPNRRTTLEKGGAISGLPASGASGTARRQSNGVKEPVRTLRRTSASTQGLGGQVDDSGGGNGCGEMRPPPSRRKMSDVGETY